MEGHNHFLNALSPGDMALIQGDLSRVQLARDDLLAQAGAPVRHVHLPINCVISVVAVMRDGRCVETRTIGCEGGFGLLHALGSPLSLERVVAQVGGACWRLPIASLAEAARESPSLVAAVARHAQASMLQAAQSAACNTLHSAEQRLARWLLLTRERLGSEVMPLTQEHLSVMLGVQRTTVTAVASELQARGLVAYSRGRIRIIDRPGLMACACECYEAIEWAGDQMRQHDAA